MNFSIPMALADYIPVFLFGAAGFLLLKDLYNKMSKGAYALLAAGIINIFYAGFFKALYKLLYASGICDFKPLSNMFFPVQALGFVMFGVAMCCMLLCNQGKGRIYCLAVSAAPVLFNGTFIFVAMMILGLLGIDISLSIISSRIKCKKAIIMFVISFIFTLGMGYLSSKDFTEAKFNWIAEGVNIVGQGTLLLGVIMLHKAGLASPDSINIQK